MKDARDPYRPSPLNPLEVSRPSRRSVTAMTVRTMVMVNESDQADRAISTGKLRVSPHFHTLPINVVVFDGSDREHSFPGGFPA